MRHDRSTRNPFSRRRMLQALGLGGASLFLPSMFRSSSAHAEALGSVRRIVFYVTSHGTVYDAWRMRPYGEPDDQDWEFGLSTMAEADMSPILAPLWGVREKLLVLDGLSNAVGRSAAFNEHEMGHASILSGRVPIEGQGSLGRPDGPSLDQAIAEGAPDPGPIRSLEYAVGGWPVCFDAQGQPIPYEEDVFAAYERLFPGGPGDSGNLTDATRIRQAQPSVLDLVAQRYEAMAPSLSAEDRNKLEQHRDLVRDLESQLGALGDLACEGPPSPTALPAWGEPHYPAAAADVFFGLMQVALSCGITRVVTMRADTMFNATIGAPPGDIHNDYAHAAETNANAADIMTAYHVHQADGFRRLVESLDAIPDQDGTLLDSTVCVWLNELGNGSHELVNVPVVLAGGGGAFDLGRYVRWAAAGRLEVYGNDLEIGPPHNRLLVALGRSMGLDIDAFGHTEVAGVGGSISTSGVLDRIMV